MTKERWTIIIVAVVVLGVVVVKFVSGMAPKAIDTNITRAQGPKDARVQIVEFVDFQCPSCAGGFKILKEYVGKHPKDIHVQIKYFPLYKVHAHAKQSALYSECSAVQGKFWPFVDKLFDRQQQWAPMINADKAFMDIAQEVGVDLGALNACLVSEKTFGSIDQDRQLGNTLAVNSTPTYFINNKMVVGVKSMQEELRTYFPDDK